MLAAMQSGFGEGCALNVPRRALTFRPVSAETALQSEKGD
jgi:hypothetical protein